MSLRNREHDAVGASGKQAIFQRRLGVQFPHQKQTNDNQQERDGHGAEARSLPIRFLLPFIDPVGIVDSVHVATLRHCAALDKAHSSMPGGRVLAGT